MGNETRWHRPSVSFDAPPFQKAGLHLAHPGIYLEEEGAIGPFFVIVTSDRCTISPFPSCPRMTLSCVGYPSVGAAMTNLWDIFICAQQDQH
jgi:hypothetical protein